VISLHYGGKRKEAQEHRPGIKVSSVDQGILGGNRGKGLMVEEVWQEKRVDGNSSCQPIFERELTGNKLAETGKVMFGEG